MLRGRVRRRCGSRDLPDARDLLVQVLRQLLRLGRWLGERDVEREAVTEDPAQPWIRGEQQRAPFDQRLTIDGLDGRDPKTPVPAQCLGLDNMSDHTGKLPKRS